MACWKGVINAEKEFFNGIYHKLIALDHSSKTSRHPDLEQIYAGVHKAYSLGMNELDKMKNDLSKIDICIERGALPCPSNASNALSVPRKRASLHLMGGFRCLQKRPSEHFRSELQKQSAAFMAKLNGLVNDKTVNDHDLETYIQHVVPLLCEMDIPMEIPEKKTIWPMILKNVAILGAGWGVRGLWDQNKHYVVGKK